MWRVVEYGRYSNSFYLFGPDLHGRCFLASVPIGLIDQLIGLRFEDKNQELPAGCGCQLKTRPGAGGHDHSTTSAVIGKRC